MQVWRISFSGAQDTQNRLILSNRAVFLRFFDDFDFCLSRFTAHLPHKLKKPAATGPVLNL